MARDVSLENYSIPELVETAVSCIDPDSNQWRVSGWENSDLYDKTSELLITCLDLELREYKLSRRSLKGQLRQFLNSIKDKEDPGAYFVDHLQDLKEALRDLDTASYKFVFPLNLTYRSGYSRDEFESLGYTFSRIERQEWIDDYLESAREEAADNTAHQTSRLEEFLDLIPDDVNQNRNWTYWTVEVVARDPHFALAEATRALEFLLGRINIVHHVNQPEGRTFGGRLWPSGRSDLREPPIYLVWKDDAYFDFARGGNLAPRRRVEIPRQSGRRFEHYFERFPEVESPLKGVEEYFVEAVLRYQGAITEDDRARSFLEYWRGLETLMLTRPEESMDRVIQRASAPLAPNREGLFEDRLNLARLKRNDLVHGSGRFTVTRHDQNLLQLVLEQALFIYCNKLPDWSREDFETFLENAGKDEGTLERELERLESQIDVIDSILDEVRFEEGFFLRTMNDWFRGRGELEEIEFADPFGFYLPVFGVGDEESSIMVVQMAPAYPTSDGVIRRRERIPGPRPLQGFWGSVDQYRSMCEGLVRNGNSDGIGDLLEAVAEEADRDVEEIYYTTIQKDGRFDENLDETEDGHNPRELNRESIETWKPYLREEIEQVNPDLIICLGDQATEIVLGLVNTGQPVEVSEVPPSEVFWVDAYGIVRLPRLQEIDQDEGHPLDGAVRSAVQEL